MISRMSPSVVLPDLPRMMPIEVVGSRFLKVAHKGKLTWVPNDASGSEAFW